jgi:signal transduction histidine kinase
MPIWSKLGLIMIVPTIATVVVGTSGLIENLDKLDNANRAQSLANLALASGDLVHNLQDERALAVLLLGDQATDPATKAARQKYRDAYLKLHTRVDESKAPYSQQRAELSDLPPSFVDLLNRIDQGLIDLPATRSQVDTGKLLLTSANQTYEVLISNLLDMRDAAAQLAGDVSLSERMRAAAATSRAKEFASQRRVVVHRGIINDRLTPVLRTEFIKTIAGQDQAEQTFKSVATRAEGELFDQTNAGPDKRQIDGWTQLISSLQDESLNNLPFTADKWDEAMVSNANLLRKVEVRLDDNVVAQATRIRDDVQQQVFLETGLLVSMLLLAILFAYLVARSMARSLRELRQGALSVARYGLPQAVSRLRDPGLSAQMSPAQLANQIAEPLPVRSKDEFGQVTEAFNAVHREAVRTAAEQAVLRASVATMFVNLARRSQILVDRLIGHLDRLERGEEDPDRLAELFQLDHLATRMRRNDENLLVLAGADSTRVQREPAALIDVLRAAQSEVEHYTRIEFGIIDRDIEVAAHAVNDLVHLVAELFDNATAFSPPDSQVMVEARRIGDRASLYVEDRGIGITADQLHELNERLATPPQMDVTISRMMGLVVVARLASRHGVKVELRPGNERGTVADVTLPTAVLVPRALSGRGQPQPGTLAGASPQPTLAQAPTFGPSLALAGGPVAAPQQPGPQEPAPVARDLGQPPRNGAPSTHGRQMPAWSDLTGASMGNTGDVFGQRPASGSAADAFQRPANGAAEAFQRPANGSAADAFQRPANGAAEAFRRPANGAGGTGPSDAFPQRVPGANGPDAFTPRTPSNAPDPFGPSRPASGADQLPKRRATEPATPEPVDELESATSEIAAPTAWANPTPRGGTAPQVPQVPAPPPAANRFTAPPQRPAPATGPVPVSPARPTVQPPGPVPQPPVPQPTAQSPVAPPAWPPVTGPGRPPAGASAPERLDAAIDMTAELPRVPSTEVVKPATPPPPADVRARFADETMELPIFRELESAWFRTRRPTTGEKQATAAGSGNGQLAAAARMAAPNVAGSAGVPRAGGPGVQQAPADNGARQAEQPGSAWQTAADEGWRKASAVTEVAVSDTTATGLPKRVPMAQLVPGGVERPTNSVQRRTPEAVRGLLSAYHRGVQRGRSHTSDEPARSPQPPTGPQSSRASSGPMAGSGQKEHEE